jgi:hypothetical protein
MRFVYTALVFAIFGISSANDSSHGPDCGAPFCTGGSGSAAVAMAEWRNLHGVVNGTVKGTINRPINGTGAGGQGKNTGVGRE